MKTPNYLAIMTMLIVCWACQPDVLVDSPSPGPTVAKQAFHFVNLQPANLTRSSLTAQTGFPLNDSIVVYAFEYDEEDGKVYKLFNKQRVVQTSKDKWTYSPLKYWSPNMSYDFYAMHPYGISHRFDDETRLFSIDSFTVHNDSEQQLDLMIAEENHTKSSTVSFTFNHILSNVNFRWGFDARFNPEGIQHVEIQSFQVAGIDNTGSYQQEGFSSQLVGNNVVGTWTISDESEQYAFPQVTTDSITPQKRLSDLRLDLLLLPQDLSDVVVSFSYVITYADGLQSPVHSKTIPLQGTRGVRQSDNGLIEINAWKPNYRYHYNLLLNPAKNDRHEWDADWNGSLFGDGPVVGTLIYLPTGEFVIWDDKNDNGQQDEGELYPVVWADLDGDGMLEGGVDRDGDGLIDNVDGDSEGYPIDSHPNNPDHRDVILVDTNNDGVGDTPLRKDPDSGDINIFSNVIEFHAIVDDWATQTDTNDTF